MCVCVCVCVLIHLGGVGPYLHIHMHTHTHTHTHMCVCVCVSVSVSVSGYVQEAKGLATEPFQEGFMEGEFHKFVRYLCVRAASIKHTPPRILE